MLNKYNANIHYRVTARQENFGTVKFFRCCEGMIKRSVLKHVTSERNQTLLTKTRRN